jgi:hypothetical protein
MFKSLFSTLIIISFFYANIFPQDKNSIQINGGIIYPMSSSKGLSASLQYNYSLTTSISLYFNSGYASWDKHYVTYKEALSPVQQKQHFKTYSSDDHKLISINLGGRINLHTNKLFTSFVDLEAGYSFLSYNSYNHWKSVNPETGEVLGYSPNPFPAEIKENIFGIGAGAGLSHPMTKNVNLIFIYKLNSNLTSDYSGIFGSFIYSMFSAGFNINI